MPVTSQRFAVNIEDVFLSTGNPGSIELNHIGTIDLYTLQSTCSFLNVYAFRAQFEPFVVLGCCKLVRGMVNFFRHAMYCVGVMYSTFL
jgi:hypothetical protein